MHKVTNALDRVNLVTAHLAKIVTDLSALALPAILAMRLFHRDMIAALRRTVIRLPAPLDRLAWIGLPTGQQDIATLLREYRQ